MSRQMWIENFEFPYGQLEKDSEWGKLADLAPWDEAKEAYLPGSHCALIIK